MKWMEMESYTKSADSINQIRERVTSANQENVEKVVREKKLQEIHESIICLICETEKQLFTVKVSKRKTESMKEIFTNIYLPIQLAIWAVGNFRIGELEITGLTMIFFTVIFAFLINNDNKLIFHNEIIYEELERVIDEYKEIKAEIENSIKMG